MIPVYLQFYTFRVVCSIAGQVLDFRIPETPYSGLDRAAKRVIMSIRAAE